MLLLCAVCACFPTVEAEAEDKVAAAHVLKVRQQTIPVDLDASQASTSASVLRPCSVRSGACIAQGRGRSNKVVPARGSVRADMYRSTAPAVHKSRNSAPKNKNCTSFIVVQQHNSPLGSTAYLLFVPVQQYSYAGTSTSTTTAMAYTITHHRSPPPMLLVLMNRFYRHCYSLQC